MKKDGVAVGVVLNVLGQVAIVLSGGAVSIILARKYDKDLFGQWSIAAVYGAMVGAIIEGGLSRLLLRDASRDRAAAGRTLGAVLKGRLLLSAITVPIAMAIAWYQGHQAAALLLVFLIVLSRVFQGLLGTYQNVLIAFEYFRASNLIETARRAGMFVAVAIIALAGWSIHWAAVATLAFTAAGTTYLMRLTKTLADVDYRAPLKDYWRDGAWFWINGILFWLNSELALLILRSISGDDAMVGINAAAQRVAMLFLVIPRGVNNSIVPRLFRSAKDGKNLHKQLNATTLLLTAIAGVAAVELWVHADPIIHLAFSAKYEASIPALQVYGLFLMLNFMRTPPSWYLTTSDRLKTITVFFGVATVLTVIANLVLIPKIGGLGTAWACVASELLLFILATAVTVRATGAKILIAFALGAIPGLAALALETLLPDTLPWFVSAGIVSVLFAGAMLFAVKKLTRGWNPLGILSSDSAPVPASS